MQVSNQNQSINLTLIKLESITLRGLSLLDVNEIAQNPNWAIATIWWGTLQFTRGLDEFKDWKIVWVSRNYNGMAHKLFK